MNVKSPVSIGDIVPRSGVFTEPGVVVDKKPDGTVTVDTEPLTLNKYHRYANTTGLSEDEKAHFNNVLDQIYQKTDNIERINDIQQEVDKLRLNPNNTNVVRYLRHQQAFLIREAKGLPRMYQTLDGKAKG